MLKGEGGDLLNELAVITSELEEMLAEEVGVDAAEKLIDDAIEAGRAYNHIFIFKDKEGK